MNKVYRVIWNSSQRCMVVVSELANSRGKSNNTAGIIPAVVRRPQMLQLITAGGLLAVSTASFASNPQVVDNTTATFEGETVMTARAESAMIVKGSAANAIFDNGFISASAPTANAVQVQDGATFDVRNSTMQTFQTPVMTVLSGSTAKIANSELSTISGSAALIVGENSTVTGNDVRITSSKDGMLVDDASVKITGLNIRATGTGGGTNTAITATNGSNIDLDTATLLTEGVGGHGIYANASDISANNIDITTTNASARGVLATGNDTHVTLNGGSINTQGANAHAIQATLGASVDISNMNLTTTAMRQAGDNGAAAIYADRGASVKADSLNLTSAGNAIWINNARVDANNLHITQKYDAYGPMIWGLASSQLNLTNSVLMLGEGMSQSQGIYVDAGTANLDGVTITGNSGGTGITTRYNGTLHANNLDIAINNADNDYAAGLYLSRGSSQTTANVSNSKVVVNGSNAAGIRSDVGAVQTVNLTNTLIASDNVAAKADASSALLINADASTLTGKTLIQGGTANSTNAVVGFIRLNATNGSQLLGDAAIDKLYTRDSLIALDNASAWQGAAKGLHQLTLDNGSQWAMTEDSDVGSINLKNSQIVFMHNDSGFRELTVDGDFNSDNGTLVMNNVLAGDDSPHDQLVVNGNTSGNTQVVINKAGGNGAQTLQGIELISVAGDSNGEFTQQGRIVAGAYDYHLQRGTDSNSKNWYLVSGETPVTAPDPDPVGGDGDIGAPVITPPQAEKMNLRPEAGNYIANIAATNTLFNLRLHDRGGETQYVDALSGEKKVTSLWMRSLGGHQQVRDSSGQLKTETNRYVLQMGGDLLTTDNLHLGAMAGYGNARSNTDSNVTGYRSQGHTTGYNLGVYGTWYQQPEQQTGAYVDSWLQYSWFNNSVNGDHLSAERYQSRGFTASLESGYSWKLSQDSYNNSYFIEPNAQFIWMGVKADDVTEANGTRVTSQGDGNVQSSLGVRASMKTAGENGQTVFKPYLEANWINNSKTFATSLDGVKVSAQGEKNIAELRVGVDSQLRSNLNLWGSVGQQAGNNHYRDTSAAIGVKLSF
ncbi:autotransporter outer membrane beta-barrel domain-containing protein [Pantoea trifolii]|uniref:autotransporter outer membrane beta-barrel domain-containing protein n=1 Tax=Candidatus Pantoea symbiotica TaxID=1884370 RepID=UPI0024130E71|nr:autotransporter outer membrane beta-barrel domain-containing protein [Pantoea rodasii]